MFGPPDHDGAPPIDGRNAASAPLSPSDPATVGGYTLLGRLGAGGMGTVYLGSAEDGRLVAVKVLRREYAQDPDFTARFRSEVEHAQAVASFCTAQVLGHGEDPDGLPYMVTEFIPGTSLDHQISSYGKLEPATLHGVAFGVAAALTAIHAAGLVHRDLKPANVILSMSGPRVIDFGIARAVDATHGHTKTGELVGTPGWWAPEQLRNNPIGPAADVFTWGCLVAYAGNGAHPFGTGDPMVLAHRILETEPDLGDLPEMLRHLVRRALNRWPDNRPTAQELLLALVSGTAEPVTHPTGVNELAGVPEVAETIEELWSPPSNVRDLQSGTTSPGRSGPPLLMVIAVAAALVLAVGAGLFFGLRDGEQGKAIAAADPTRRTSDIGRRIDVQDVQLVVQKPSCRIRTEADQSCVIEWALLNMGATPVDLGGRPDLVDDRGVGHVAVRDVRPAPVVLEPGEMLAMGAEYLVPAGRAAVRLRGPIVAGGRIVEVRL
ncbi:hypothetical protein Pth03_12800 [Planotetraspora thailandica]|uniref:Protein kinase domain-containing protein n=1 Tax=Planotetraspora thailandica TaxID=487172 RepID=A0A8J3V0N6_9ACTN|nr:serine/threonine-protein kinase [Planotetraspora thailandica]GII52891.1 hypothetical protein Pth03_12800 [Planotetraspora thailandica]